MLFRSQGLLGEPEGGWPKKFRQIVLSSAKVEPIKGRPGASLPPADFDQAAADLASRTGREPSEEDVLSYLLYPQVFLEFEQHRRQYGDTSTIPTANFFYGMQPGDETAIEIERGKTLIVKFLTTGEVREDGTRTVFFELNGQPREVTVTDRGAAVTAVRRQRAEVGNPAHIAAPMPGKVSAVSILKGQFVRAGEPLFSLEAMKMETTVHAERDGRVAEVLVAPGTPVEAGELALRYADA
mgnify:CR=1 FL=1